jgi:hypothetical protein
MWKVIRGLEASSGDMRSGRTDIDTSISASTRHVGEQPALVAGIVRIVPTRPN